MAKPPQPLLRKADFSAYLETRAREMAPRDVEVLLSEAENARTRAAALSPRIGSRMALALELLDDHHSGQAPQIPFYTISVLAEAVYYFLDPNDVIPDWIPAIGKLDDAVVLELAFELGVDGIRRYCAWKGIDDSTLYGSASQVVAEPRPKADRPRAAASRAKAVKRPAKKSRTTTKSAAQKSRTAPKAGAKKKRSGKR